MKTKIILPLTAMLLISCGGGNSSSAPAVSSQSEKSSEASVVNTSQGPAATSELVSSSAEPKTQYKVTFHWNFEGAQDSEVLVDEGEVVTAPATIDRQGYLFQGWFLEAAAETSFDFSTPIVAATDLYAGWLLDDGNTISCTFYWNIDAVESPIYQTVYFKKGGRMTKPADPVLDGYSFRGWFAEGACENAFSVTKKYEESVVAYAKWFNTYTLEAEYTQFTDLPEDDTTANEYGDKIGHGYSSDVSGLGLIFQDTDNSNCKASNGYFVCDLYYYNAYLEFDITVDKAVDDAVLVARLSAEYFDMTFVPSERNENGWDGNGTPKSGYDITVNGVTLDYSDIVIAGVITGRDNPKKRDFTNYNISSSLSLKEGKNVIKMITKNNHRHDSTGTMAAMAPMIDCLYLSSDAGVQFDAHKGNIK